MAAADKEAEVRRLVDHALSLWWVGSGVDADIGDYVVKELQPLLVGVAALEAQVADLQRRLAYFEYL
jgi:hypothetical protein